MAGRGRLAPWPAEGQESAERTVGLTVRVALPVAEWLRLAALKEHRSISGQVARLLDDCYAEAADR